MQKLNFYAKDTCETLITSLASSLIWLTDDAISN